MMVLPDERVVGERCCYFGGCDIIAINSDILFYLVLAFLMGTEKIDQMGMLLPWQSELTLISVVLLEDR